LPFGKLKVPSPIEGPFDFLKALSHIEGLKASRPGHSIKASKWP
jgi:hypothetical protein